MGLYARLGIGLVIVSAFAGYTAWVAHLGASGPKAELQALKDEIVAAKKIHDAEDAAREAQSKTIIEEKDHEREKLLADAGRAWADELERMRGERDRIARAGAKSTRIVTAICDSADANQRLSDALGQAERDVRSAIEDYKGGVGALLSVAQQQAIEWDNLKAAVTALRVLNTAPKPSP